MKTQHPELLDEDGFVDWHKLWAWSEANPGCIAKEVFCGVTHTCAEEEDGHPGPHWDCTNMEHWTTGHEQDCWNREENHHA